MTAERADREDPRLQSAIEELRGLILRRYPDATFSLSRGHDDPEIIHLNATVDVEDLDEIIDLVIERELELQVEQGLPIHVIPTRPLERVLAMRQAAAAVRPPHT
jgi:hypothetical protein